MTQNEPFLAGREVEEPYFFNRVSELKELIRKISSTTPLNIALHGQRRIGKSSILKRLRNEFTNSVEVIPIMIRCELILPKTPDNFARLIINRLRYLTESGGAFRPQTEEEILKKVRKKRIEMIISSNDGKTEKKIKTTSEFQGLVNQTTLMLDVAFEMIEEIQKTNEMKIVFFMDEFQELFPLGNEFLWALRGYISESKSSFVVSSSHHRFYEYLHSDEKNPFFNFFELMHIRGVKHSDAKKYILERFRVVGKEITNEAISYILTLCDGKPYYIQLICSRAYDIILRKKSNKIDLEILKQAFDKIFESPPNHVVSLFNLIQGNKAKQVFISMCVHNFKNSSEISEKLGNISPSSVRQTLNQLERIQGIVKKTNAKTNNFIVVDKFLKEWVKREYTPKY